MTAFEQHLINNGWTKSVWTRNGLRPATDNDYLSSMGNIDFRYCKDGREIVFGLGEKDKPPTLLYPIPFTEAKSTIGYIARWLTTDEIIRLLATMDFDKLIEIIFSNKAIEI